MFFSCLFFVLICFTPPPPRAPLFLCLCVCVFGLGLYFRRLGKGRGIGSARGGVLRARVVAVVNVVGVFGRTRAWFFFLAVVVARGGTRDVSALHAAQV